jgi:hypothetical protein
MFPFNPLGESRNIALQKKILRNISKKIKED